MPVRLYFAVAILLAPLVAASCGGATDDTQPRQANPLYPTSTRPIGASPNTDMGPPPQNMPGGGRGYDPPHFKGKP